MSDSTLKDPPEYTAFRAFAREVIRLEVFTAMEPLKEQIRSLKTELETRAVPEPKIIEGPPGKNGIDGKDGFNGKDGADGKPGERGTDGIATREELKAAAQEVFADFQVRTFADIYQGVYESGKTYTRGVLTTWGGSLFLSKAETSSKPGESADWQLVVKRGADGKDVGARR